MLPAETVRQKKPGDTKYILFQFVYVIAFDDCLQKAVAAFFVERGAVSVKGSGQVGGGMKFAVCYYHLLINVTD